MEKVCIQELVTKYYLPCNNSIIGSLVALYYIFIHAHIEGAAAWHSIKEHKNENRAW